MSELEGCDLDRAIAELLGDSRNRVKREWYYAEEWRQEEVDTLPEPPFHVSLDACAQAEKVLLDDGWVCEIGLAKSDNYEACDVTWFVNARAANFHPPAVEMYAREELPLRAQALHAALLLRAKMKEGEA